MRLVQELYKYKLDSMHVPGYNLDHWFDKTLPSLKTWKSMVKPSAKSTRHSSFMHRNHIRFEAVNSIDDRSTYEPSFYTWYRFMMQLYKLPEG